MHWVEAEDARGLATWHRYVEYSHWGMFFTGAFPRYVYHYDNDDLLE